MTKLRVIQSNWEEHRARIAAELRTLDVGEIRFDRHNRMLYSTDASLYQVEPIGVVLPTDAAAVAKIIGCCSRNNVAMLPRGGGTSLAGQCTNQAIVVDLSRWQKLISLDCGKRTCVVEPGISIDSLNRLLLEKNTGLFFAPDPATTAQATIGGCIGNNAAGARSIRYGRTSENLSAVEVMLGSGERTWLGAGGNDDVGRMLAARLSAVARKYRGEIRERFPKLIRRNAGYGIDLILDQLDRGIAEADVDLSGLICGSEGSLAVTISAELKLKTVPLGRGLLIASFTSLEAAIDMVPAILATGASAVELLDDVVLEAARGNIQTQQYLELLPRIDGRLPGAVLYVEYQAERSIGELNERFEVARETLGTASVAVYCDSSSMTKAWTLRKSGEALLHGLSATRKPVTFVEDNAIPVENLSRFVAEFKKLVGSHGTIAAYYAHASVGVLHVRPMLNLHDPGDLELMKTLAVEVADLARQCGGVMSGEHGDGRVRGPLLERFYGPRIMEAFAEIKHIFDPQNIFNPGMVVNAGKIDAITTHLRSGADNSEKVETFFDYSDQHDFPGAVEMCNGAGFCRKTSGGTMCPSYRATLDERHSTRGRGNALRLAIGGQSLPDGAAQWNDPETIETLDLCLSCKACKSECPSNVDISRLKAEYTAQRFAAAGRIPLDAKVFGHIRAINQLGSLAPGIANWLSNRGPVRGAINRALGLHPRRSLPKISASLFRWFDRRPPSFTDDRPRVVIFGDCFTAYNEPEIGRSAVAVLEALGYATEVVDAGCCGRAMISTGLLPQAIATADATLARLRVSIEDPAIKAIIVCEPSCLSAMKDDWLSLKLKTEPRLRRLLAGKAMLAEDFVEQSWGEHPIQPAAAKFEGEIIFHGHCHQKALWGDQSSAAAMRRFVGEHLTVLPSGCCGMAGSFGFTANHFDLSMKIGELSVFPPIRGAPTAVIAATGTSCRHQILDATGRHALHPIQLLGKIFQV